ncbi:MAG: helicase-associated domain-containing protein, partial [Treponema maltophilum]
SADFLQKMHKALLNLSLFRKKEFGRETLFEPDFAKWKSFALLPPLSRASYIAAAFCLADCSSPPYGVPRDELQKAAALVRDFLSLVPPQGLFRQNAQRLLFLLKERQGEFPQKENRFRRLLRESFTGTAADISETGETLKPETLADALILFGLLQGSATGKNRDEAFEVFTVNSELYAPSSLRGSDETGSELLDNSVSINAGFSITVLKELPLSVFIELASCTELESCAAVASFRITKAACLRAFAGGAKPEGIESLLKKTASHELPQNLLFSLRDWYALYSSGSLFKGYVLQVAEDKRVLVENNPSLAPHIRTTFSPGVYLLDFLNDDEAFETIKKSGLEFIGGLKNPESGIEPLPFERLDTAARFSGGTDGLDVLFAKKSTNADSMKNDEFCEKHLRQMETELEKMNLPKEQKEELLLRINRKTIVHSAQLRSDSVRPEKTEAFGMDFLGKIHVLESAIAFSDLVEINSAGGIITGFPVKIEKSAGDAVLVLQSDDVKNADIKNGTESQKISVAQARSVKRIRSSVLGRTK